jgi:prolyl-tRNA synthetase
VHGESTSLVALVLRGDHELNAVKAEKLPGIAKPLTFATDQEIIKSIGCAPGSIGPVNLNVQLFVDHAAAQCADFACGANSDGKHLVGVNWGRDLPNLDGVDLRNVVEGDLSPDGNGVLSIVRGIEVGHIFQLGDKYSRSMNATVLNEHGQEEIMLMGCYGIGVSRIVAAAIEQNHDQHGIIWPYQIAPFQVALAPINLHKSQRLRQTAETLYSRLNERGISVLLDDRNIRPGAMFADLELIGIPHRLVLSERGLETGQAEYKGRRDSKAQMINLDETPDYLLNLLSNPAPQ